MPTIRLFAQARVAAGTARDTLAGSTVSELLSSARAKYGGEFAALLGTCTVWLNGEPAAHDDHVDPEDELAVLPPVCGG
jgi:molybdopterin converting factor small subunit